MGVYKRFEDTDFLQTIIHTRPRIILASGSAGWKGNVGDNGKLSLYGDIRARRDVKSEDFSTSGISVYPLDELETYSIDKSVFISGSYPATASVSYVKVRNTEPENATDINDTNWYEEHFRPIELLYEYYSRYNPNYFTGSHDFYSLYFQSNASLTSSVVAYSGSNLSTVTSSFTVEAWVKPMFVTSSAQDFTIMGQRTKWKFYITGSAGKLAFTDFATILTSSEALTPGIWNHIAFSSNATTGTFYINNEVDSALVFTGTLANISEHVSCSFLAVGAAYVLDPSSVPAPDQGFKGFLFETRVWNVTRTAAQVSGTWNRTLTAGESGSANLVHYSRFNDGPVSTAHGFTQGSGAFDYSSTAVHGRMHNFRTVLPLGPTWHPNDNEDFTTYKTKVYGATNFMRLIHIPSMFYGRQIATGSVVLECHSYNKQGIVRTLKDDGRGNLYLSGSVTRRFGFEDYKGVSWRKVGNVFYNEGLITITDPALWDFGDPSLDSSTSTDLLRLTFEGYQKIPSKVFMCRLPAAEFNASNNPTFSYPDPGDPEDVTDDRNIIRSNTTYITAVGLYDEHRRLVAVAKIAQPIRKREKDRLTIRLKFDF